MKTFRIVFEFQDAPDNFPMDVAKKMVMKMIDCIPDEEETEHEGEYVITVSSIEQSFETQSLN